MEHRGPELPRTAQKAISLQTSGVQVRRCILAFSNDIRPLKAALLSRPSWYAVEDPLHGLAAEWAVEEARSHMLWIYRDIHMHTHTHLHKYSTVQSQERACTARFGE